MHTMSSLFSRVCGGQDGHDDDRLLVVCTIPGKVMIGLSMVHIPDLKLCSFTTEQFACLVNYSTSYLYMFLYFLHLYLS